jgi:hypothetical protein
MLRTWAVNIASSGSKIALFIGALVIFYCSVGWLVATAAKALPGAPNKTRFFVALCPLVTREFNLYVIKG